MTQRMTTEEDPQESISLDSLFSSRCGTYLLRVKGDSLLSDHIRDRDFVIIERASTDPKDGLAIWLTPDGVRSLRRAKDAPEGSICEGCMIGLLRTYKEGSAV